MHIICACMNFSMSLLVCHFIIPSPSRVILMSPILDETRLWQFCYLYFSFNSGFNVLILDMLLLSMLLQLWIKFLSSLIAHCVERLGYRGIVSFNIFSFQYVPGAGFELFGDSGARSSGSSNLAQLWPNNCLQGPRSTMYSQRSGGQCSECVRIIDRPYSELSAQHESQYCVCSLN